MKTLYTIQIFPEGSSKIRSYQIKRIWIKLFAWLICLVAILIGVCIWKFAEIDMRLANYWGLKAENERLLNQHSEYASAFAELDSIYAIEFQIQNILGTYFEDDSVKIRSVLERNNFMKVSAKSMGTERDLELAMNKQNLEVFPNMLPVMGAVSRGYSDEHKAVDFVAALDEPVFATAVGKVIFAGNRGDRGIVVEIDHGGGIVTVYSHLSRFSIKNGSTVKKGENIGFVGNTGNSSSAHLHYEILFNGKPVNPEKYF